MTSPPKTSPAHRLARWWDDLVRPAATVPAATQGQARLLTGLLLVQAGIFAALVPVRLALSPGAPWWASGTALMALTTLVALALARLSRGGRCRLAAGLLVAYGTAVIFAQAVITSQRAGDVNILGYLVLIVVFASLFFNVRAMSALLAAHMLGTLPLLLVPGITFNMLSGPLQFNLIAGALYLLIMRYYARLEQSRREALLQSEARYRELVESARDLVYTLSLGGEILSLNPVAEALSGWSKEEMIGRPFADFIHPDDLPVAVAAFEQLLAGKTPDLFQVRAQTKTGPYLWAEFNSIPLFQDGVITGISGIGRLIEERRQMEDALRRSEELYRTLIHNLPDGIVMLFDRDMRYHLIEGQGVANVKWKREDLLGKTVRESLDAELVKALEPVYRRALAGTPQTFEIDDAGRSYWVQVMPVKNDRDEVIAGMVVAQDTTRQKQTEQQFRAIFEYSPDAIFIMEPGSGRIVDCNPAACQMNGYSREELIGQPISMVNALDEVEIQTYIEQVRQFGAYRFEFLHRHKDGTIFPIEVVNALVKVGGRELILGIDRDITERRQAEAALRRSEELYRTLIHNLPDGIVMLFDRDMRYHLVEGQGIANVKWKREDLLGKTVQEALGAELAEALEPVYSRALAGTPQTLEIDDAGRSYWVQVMPIKNDRDEVIAGMVVAQDTTRQKQTEQQFRAIFEYSPDAIFILEPATRQILDCNPMACQMNGYSREELIGQPINMVNASNVIDPDAYLDELRHQGMLRYETLHRTKEGTVFPVEVTTTLLNVSGRELLMGMDRDITERRQAEAALRRSEERYRTLVENFPNGLVALFGHDLRYTVVGGQGLSASGLSPEMFEGKRLDEIFPPDVYERDEPALTAALAGLTTVAEVEYGGREYVVHTLPVRDENGQVTGGMVMTQDITEAKQMQEKQLKLALERERLGLMNRFVEAISHDFRTSLSVIETSRHLIERTLEPEARQQVQPKMRNIQEQISRISEQLDNLNMIAGLLKARRSPCDINELFIGLLNERASLAERKRLRLRFDPADIKPIVADGHALHHALRHLLTNAINFTPEGGSVSVRTGQANGSVMIEISDTGIGISAADLPHVFDLFFRADPARGTASGGVGIGLTIAKLVVEAHGGQITAESQPDVGTTFRVTLPQRV